MNVTVTEWYVPGCPTCIEAIETIVRSGVRDATVTKMSLGAGHRHNHPEQRKPKMVGATAETPTTPAVARGDSPPDQPMSDLFEAALPRGENADSESTTNSLPNGFDTQG